MKKCLIILSFLFLGHLLATSIRAQSSTTSPQHTGELELIDLSEITASASQELNLATAAAQERAQERKDRDLTDASGKQKSELALFLEQNPPDPLSWNNFFQHAIVRAVERGMPANTLVLVILFPLIAALIAASRHVIGLRGFGIYIPAVLAVAFVSTGIIAGLILFIAISTIAVLANKILKKSKLPYLPRTAMLLWTISLGLFALFVLAPMFNLTDLMSFNIFPILILVLLSENFLDAQSRNKDREALALTVETLILAISSSLLLNWGALQRFALTEPELLLIMTLLVSAAIGKFSGLRVTERLRFRSMIEEEE